MKRAILFCSWAWVSLALAQSGPWKEWAGKGDAALKEKKYEEAAGFFSEAFKLEPTSAALLYKRGNCYASLDRTDEALRDLDLAIERQLIDDGYWETEDLAQFYFRKGYVCDRGGRLRDAIPCYEKAIKLNKTYLNSHNNLAWIWATAEDATLRDPDRAIEFAKKELELRNENHVGTMDTLAAAYAAKGMFDEAVEMQAKALELGVPEELKKEFQERLELYRKKQAFVEIRKKGKE